MSDQENGLKFKIKKTFDLKVLDIIMYNGGFQLVKAVSVINKSSGNIHFGDSMIVTITSPTGNINLRTYENYPHIVLRQNEYKYDHQF